ncbi:hypothetical protein [Luteimonas lutimaris]|uniref:Sulfotransferase domain-containing protein n=1 Tax=Luteimonas lutimaris TaxID=698645 RepID=A0ABP7MWR6_9GAMM
MMHYVCIGHAKCGTTLLDSVFRSSRIVGTPVVEKELKFFLPPNIDKERGRQRYVDEFEASGGGRAFTRTFEASPQYSQQKPEVLDAVLRLVGEVLRDVRIIICFRHPVLRAYSHYIHDIHKFALYGDQVYSPRPALLQKPFRSTFKESMPRLARSYSATLQRAIDVLGRERISLFFLEQDANHLDSWVARNFDAEVAQDVSTVAAGIGPVFARRPVPNYVVSESCLHAFGSNPGEYIRYQGLTVEDAARILQDRERWSLRLDPDEAKAISEEYFRSDIEKCMELTGDETFAQYLVPPSFTETAGLADMSLLESMHGVVLDRCGREDASLQGDASLSSQSAPEISAETDCGGDGGNK